MGFGQAITTLLEIGYLVCPVICALAAAKFAQQWTVPSERVIGLAVLINIVLFIAGINAGFIEAPNEVFKDFDRSDFISIWILFLFDAGYFAAVSFIYENH